LIKYVGGKVVVLKEALAANVPSPVNVCIEYPPPDE
jgi:hypothetical protein